MHRARARVPCGRCREHMRACVGCVGTGGLACAVVLGWAKRSGLGTRRAFTPRRHAASVAVGGSRRRLTRLLLRDIVDRCDVGQRDTARLDHARAPRQRWRVLVRMVEQRLGNILLQHPTSFGVSRPDLSPGDQGNQLDIQQTVTGLSSNTTYKYRFAKKICGSPTFYDDSNGRGFGDVDPPYEYSVFTTQLAGPPPVMLSPRVGDSSSRRFQIQPRSAGG